MNFFDLLISKIFGLFKNIEWYIQKKRFYNIFKNSTCDIGFNVRFFNSKNIVLGENIFFGDNVLINAGKGGKIYIGDNTALAEGIKILSWLKDVQNQNVKQKILGKDVFIGNNVRIGYNVIIMPGVKIGNNAKISPLSVVYNDIPSNGLAMGNPAEIIE